jgi:hypothetical protein
MYECYEILIDKLYSEDAAIGFLLRVYQAVEDELASEGYTINGDEEVEGGVDGGEGLPTAEESLFIPDEDIEVYDTQGTAEEEVELETPTPVVKPKTKAKTNAAKSKK